MRRAEEVSRVGFPTDYNPTKGNYGHGLYLTTSKATGNNFGDMVTRNQGRPGAILTLVPHPKKVFEARAGLLQDRLNELEFTRKAKESKEISDLLKAHGYDALKIGFQRETWLVLFNP